MKKFIILTVPLFFTHVAEAACATPGQYQLIAPFGTLSGCVDLVTYLKGMFETLIGIAGILAVVMIIWCGIKLMTAGSAGGKTEAKSCITNAIFGILLSVGGWLLLNTINPFLLLNKNSVGPTIGTVAPSPVTPSTPTGVLSWQAGPSCPAITGTVVSVTSPASCSGTAPTATSVCCQYISVPVAPVPPSIPPPVIPPFLPPTPVTIPVTGSVAVNLTAQSINEGSSTATIVVRRVGTLAGTINYSLVVGSATAGLDFGAISGTLSFPTGVDQLSVTIPIIEDTLVEGDEQFDFVLSSPSGGLILDPRNNRITITIVDNDVDTIPPVISILYPLGGIGFVTTTQSLDSLIQVTEETKLAKVDLQVSRSSTTVPTFTRKLCGTIGKVPVCPTYGATFSTSTVIGPYVNEYFTIMGKACDAAGNCASTTTKVGYTLECEAKSGTTTRKCFTLPSGVGATSSFAARGQTSAELIKLMNDNGGGSVSITTVAPYYSSYARSCGGSWCVYGCAVNESVGICNGGPTTPLCGGQTCVYGCAVDTYTPLCQTSPPPYDSYCGKSTWCSSGCAVDAVGTKDSTGGRCFHPLPVIVGSISATPGDLSASTTCGNGGTYPGTAALTIVFGTSTGCTLKTFFNYFFNFASTDGQGHNYWIDYNWLP